MITPTPDEICERLRAWARFGLNRERNKDDAAAADLIQQQQATIERLSAALEGLADAAGECRAALWAIEDSAVEAGFDRMGDIIAERLAKLNPAIDEARTALGKDASDDQGE
jgi:hypothetical protein